MTVSKLTAKTKNVGGIPVSRILPNARGRKTIGAWCFLDHAGPAEFGDDSLGLQVGLHPHTNLQTFTWMLSGEVLHQDSLGNKQVICPKQVNLMTAGTGQNRGISHTEQTPDYSHDLHAVQLWIALPMDKDIEPSFYNYPNLPTWTLDEVTYTLTTGEYMGYKSPAIQYSPLVGVDVLVDRKPDPDALTFEKTATKKITIPTQPNFEYGILVIKGEVTFQGETYLPDELILLTTDCKAEQNPEVVIEASYDSHFMLLGGEPLSHKTLIWWNFVDKDRAGLVQSIKEWNAQHERFGTIALEGGSLKRLIAPELPINVKLSTE